MLLAPVTASAAGDGQLGRAPISYFAPDPAFAVASDAGAAARELRQVISGLHDAGLEVILQASSVSGPSSQCFRSFRGLDDQEPLEDITLAILQGTLCC